MAHPGPPDSKKSRLAPRGPAFSFCPSRVLPPILPAVTSSHRRLATFAIVAVFSLMLAGTSKAPVPSKGSSTPTNEFTGNTAAEPPPSKGSVPSSVAWPRVSVPRAKLALRLPPGARLLPDSSGVDPTFAGAYVRFRLASGYEGYFAEKSTNEPVDIAKETKDYENPIRQVDAFLVKAKDAVVVRRKEGPPFGTYCEVTACGTLHGRPICALSEGAIDEHGKITKMTEEECLAMVAIARSFEATP